MNRLEFLRRPEVTRLIERASRAAATPVSVHFVERDEESPRIVGIGQRAFCKHVRGLGGGAGSCRASRLANANTALRHGNCTPFLCHMGFGCVIAPAFAGQGEGFTITFGPYCPAEVPEILESDVLRGMEKLGAEPPENLAELLSDISMASSGAVPAVAEWTVEELGRLWEQLADEPEPGADEDTLESESTKTKRGRTSMPEVSPYGAAEIAAALAAGNQPQVRELMLSALKEAPGTEKNGTAVRRMRALALVAAVLEAAERAGLDTAGCWERLPGFLDEVGKARSESQLASAATGVLRVISRRAKSGAPGTDGLSKLNSILISRMGESVTLRDVAAELGENPTAITHRLQRKYGMSFSQYLGKLRVEHAKGLLRRTKLSVADIAKRVGIADPSNLGKLFRTHEGCPPMEYRARFGRKG